MQGKKAIFKTDFCYQMVSLKKFWIIDAEIKVRKPMLAYGELRVNKDRIIEVLQYD